MLAYDVYAENGNMPLYERARERANKDDGCLAYFSICSESSMRILLRSVAFLIYILTLDAVCCCCWCSHGFVVEVVVFVVVVMVVVKLRAD